MKRLGTTLAAAGAVLALAAPAGAQDGTVVASHLNNPRQIDVQPGGAVYVAEAGRGGSRCTSGGEETDVSCVGTTAGLYRAWPSPNRVLSGLASQAGPDGSFAVGLDSVAVSPFGGFVGPIGGLFGPPSVFTRGTAAQSGALLKLAPFQSPVRLAQIDDFEAANDPDQQGVDSDPYGVEATKDGFYVADAAGNTLLRVDPRTGAVSLVATFTDIGGGDAVPTSVRQGPDGALYVGTLAEAAGPGGAKVYRVVPGQAPTVYADGLTTVVGLDFDKAGNLYVAELFAEPVGEVERITPGGERRTIGEGQVVLPGGVAVGTDGSVYVSNYSVAPAHGDPFGVGIDGGQVLRFTPAS